MSAESNSPTCGTCRFWVADYFLDGSLPAIGQCRRRAPYPNATALQDADTVWPSTRQLDYCGEHQPKQEAAS